MKLLVTAGTSTLGAIVGEALGKDHDVVLTDLPGRRGRVPGGVKRHELGHDSSTDDLVRGLGGVVHIGFGGHQMEATPLLDYLTRCTYNLLTACLSTGVRRFVYLHTLHVFDAYEPHLTVSERWKPLPGTEPHVLAAHLGEYVCREFAREHHQLEVVSLRLGYPLITGARAAAARTKETAALATADLSLALEKAVSAPLQKRWNPVHIQSPVPNARFLMSNAENVLAYPKKAST
ncbi:MAG: NAD(P)-dependent oxidoreductase [Chloroflexi bacterium]|nr:NAD(P)-dependent oxidoreductase [Chloroflexota bacterium]